MRLPAPPHPARVSAARRRGNPVSPAKLPVNRGAAWAQEPALEQARAQPAASEHPAAEPVAVSARERAEPVEPAGRERAAVNKASLLRSAEQAKQMYLVTAQRLYTFIVARRTQGTLWRHKP